MLDYMHIIKEDIFKDGTNIVKEGDHGKWMWVIFEGVAKVTKETANGPLEIARLGEGCFIGTFKALLFGEYSRSATVTAEGDVRLCLLEADPLYNEYSSLSPLFRQLLLSLDGRLRAVTEKTVQLFLKKDNDEKILKGKKLLLKKGAASEDLCMIKEGQAHIIGQTKNGYFNLVTLGRGDVFGYFPFVDVGHEPRSSSVLASGDLQVEKLDVQSLQEEYNKFSTTFRNMIYYLGTSIFMTTKLAYHYHRRK
ncbi:MAG: cyclic nucleotide-binding domain-containing protein [Pseudomonadota bacterium]